MALPIILIAAAIIISGARGTWQALGSQLYSDMSGFLPWLGAMLLVGLVGYIPQFRGMSMTLMALIFIAVIVSSGGQRFFQNLQSAVASGPKSPSVKVAETPTEIPIMATSELQLKASKDKPVVVEIKQSGGGGAGGGMGMG